VFISALMYYVLRSCLLEIAAKEKIRSETLIGCEKNDAEDKVALQSAEIRSY
jgi:hypothetical protein